MKIRHPLLTNVTGLLASTWVRHWMGTLDFKAVFYDPTVDPVHPGCRGQKIYIFWHEYILFPLSLRGRNHLSMLLSRHHDAEILDRVAMHLGFGTVRGSTTRGGASALRAMFRASRHRHLTITPDGPRGPRRTLAAGPIYLAARLGMPLVVMGLGYDRPWRASSWDRFAVPRPFSRARAVVSPEIHVPPNLCRDDIEHFRLRIEQLMNRLTHEAEQWAESGRRRAGEVRVRRQPARHRSVIDHGPIKRLPIAVQRPLQKDAA